MATLRLAKIFASIDEVESKSNLADEPSRPDLGDTLMLEPDAVFTSPKPASLCSPTSAKSAEWFAPDT